MKQFALDKEPIDYQVSLHIANMLATFPKFEVLATYDYIRDSKNDYAFIYEDMKPIGQRDKMHIAMYNMMMHYGVNKVDQVLTEIFLVKVA